MFRYIIILALLLVLSKAHYYTGTPCSKNSDCARDIYGPGNDCGANKKCKCFKGRSGLRCLKHTRGGLAKAKLDTATSGASCTESIVSFSDMKLMPKTRSECSPYVCTADVFQCPDGSYVDRDNRNYCYFKPCPDRTPGACEFNTTLYAIPLVTIVEASKPITIGTQIEASMLYPSPGISVYNPEIAIGSSESEKYTHVAMENFGVYASIEDCSWKAIQPVGPDTWDFSSCDTIATFAGCQNKDYKVGPLVSMFTLPEWLDNADDETTAKSRLSRYIQTVVGQYKDAKYIDVVEDALFVHEGFVGYRAADKLWYSEYDYQAERVPDYLLQSFYLARTYAPEAILGYVDYGIMNNTVKYQFMRVMVQSMIDQSDPIKPDIITFKDQLWVGWQDLFRTFNSINDLGLMGVGSVLAPLGVVVHSNDVSPTSHLITTSFSKNGQAAIYATLYKACILNPYCKGFEPRIFADKRNAYTQYAPGLFDADYSPKTVMTAIKSVASGSYQWIDEYINSLDVPPTGTDYDTVLGKIRPKPECTSSKICDANGCVNGECVVRYLEVNPENCADAIADTRISSAACDVDDGPHNTTDWFDFKTLSKPKKHIGFGRPFRPNGLLKASKKRMKEELHCSLDPYNGNGERVLVEISVVEGNYSDVGSNAFTASCNGLALEDAEVAISDYTYEIVTDWGYSEPDKIVYMVELKSLPTECVTEVEGNIKYSFQLERKGCMQSLNQQAKRFEVSMDTVVLAEAKLGVANTPDVNIVITPFPGGTVESTECVVVNADTLEYKYAATLGLDGLAPNLLWAFNTDMSDSVSDFICSDPPCLFSYNETIRIESKNPFTEGSIATDQKFAVDTYMPAEDGVSAPVLISTESVTKNLQINCISGDTQEINIINVHTEATPAVHYLDETDGKYYECTGQECDELTRDDIIALSLTLNQPSEESGLFIQSVHWSLSEGLPSGDVITIDDIFYTNTLAAGTYCGKTSVCGNCTFNGIKYSSRLDVISDISIDHFIQELLVHNPNFYATTVTINFEIEASIGYCRNRRRRLLSNYHLSHPTTPINTITRTATVGIRLGSEADEHDTFTPAAGNPTVPSISDVQDTNNFEQHHHHFITNDHHDLVSLTVSGGTNVLVLAMAILFLMALCFLYALCQRAKSNSGYRRNVYSNAVVRTRW